MPIQTCCWQYICIYIIANFSEVNMVGIRYRYDLMMNYLIKTNCNVVGVLVKTTNCLQQRNEWLAARYKMIICLLSLTFWKNQPFSATWFRKILVLDCTIWNVFFPSIGVFVNIASNFPSVNTLQIELKCNLFLNRRRNCNKIFRNNVYSICVFIPNSHFLAY